MREGVAERKVPGGKFVRVRTQLTDECVFADLTVEGDFFAYPPDIIDGLGDRVKGRSLSDALKALDHALEGVILGGVDSGILQELVKEAFGKACGDGK